MQLIKVFKVWSITMTEIPVLQLVLSKSKEPTPLIFLAKKCFLVLLLSSLPV